MAEPRKIYLIAAFTPIQALSFAKIISNQLIYVPLWSVFSGCRATLVTFVLALKHLQIRSNWWLARERLPIYMK